VGVEAAPGDGDGEGVLRVEAACLDARPNRSGFAS
jgi:hypothetical protein